MLLACALLCGNPSLLSAQTFQSGSQATTISALLPAAVAYDSAGNLYIAVRGEHVVRKVDTLGGVTTVAGTGEQGYSGDGGAATSADLDSPSGVAVDANGTIYIADSHNNAVRTVSSGTIKTFAGTGVAGFSGDNGLATAAQLDNPTALSLDAAGTLYIADTLNHRIRKVASGVITTFAGTGEQGYGGDGGQATAAQLDTPLGVSADPANAGRVYISDTHNQRIRMVNSSGVINPVAGTGSLSFGGDGGPASAAALALPKGLAVDAQGNVAFADSANQRVRSIAGTTITTLAGDGEQGFAGDLGTPAAAVLDTPSAVAISGSGAFAIADSHNQRVRAVSGTAINTIAGLPPTLTEGIVLSGPVSGVYGTSVGRLSATFANGGNVASGNAVLNDGGTAVGSAALTGNAASFDLSSLSGGLHSLVVSFGGDSANPAIASGVFLVKIAAASQSVAFGSLPTTLTYSPGLSETLNAVASSGLPISYAVTGPATITGSTLSITGPGTVVVTASQAGNNNYTSAAVVENITVAAATVVAASLSPGTVSLGASNTTLTVAGSGFTPTSVVELNGTPLQTQYVSFTSLTAILPTAVTPGDQAVTVVDPLNQTASAALDLRISAPVANASLTLPAQGASLQQPAVNVQLQTAYPVPIIGLLTLSFAPAGGQSLSDPAVLFSNGKSTYQFNVSANSTVVPNVSVSTGTLAGTLTITLQLTAAGVDVTPASARVATLRVLPQAPQIQSNRVSFTQNGADLTVTVVGFSNTRDMAQAIFQFAPAAGSTLDTSSLTLTVNDLFSGWFNNPISFGNGSDFTYTQTFKLSDPDAQVGSVTVQLVNSAGTSPQAASQ